MSEIRQLATLPDELRAAVTAGTLRTLCPTCGGGRSRELSLSIRSMPVPALRKLSCFRATCGWYCTVVVDDSVVAVTKLKQATPYRDKIYEPEIRLHNRLHTYGLARNIYAAHGWGQNEHGALVLPIRDPYGRTRGHITRTFDSPKRVFTYKATAQPWLDWWPGDGEHPIVIVEDCLSACRLAALGYTAVALLGTGINVEQAKEVASIARDGTVWLALDRDAYLKAIKLAQRHAHIIKMLPVCLDLDVKNIVRDADIIALFGGEQNG